MSRSPPNAGAGRPRAARPRAGCGAAPRTSACPSRAPPARPGRPPLGTPAACIETSHLRRSWSSAHPTRLSPPRRSATRHLDKACPNRPPFCDVISEPQKEMEVRKVIAGMQSSLDGKVEGPEGYADWVDAWSDHYNVMPRVDACLLGAGMYPGYEQYWSAIQNGPDEPLSATGKVPTPGEVEYARFAA